MVDYESLVVQYNNSAAPYPADKTILDLFAAQVQRTPEEEAIRLDDRALTYAELNQRANQVAARLRDAGAGPGHLVSLYMDHSIEVVAAILGVLKTGAAYVPLDMGTPRERVIQILLDISDGSGVACPIILTQSPIDLSIADNVVVDADFASLAAYPTGDSDHCATPEALAYVIFTSGSTGKPKGVMIEHRSLVNYIWWANKVYAQGERLSWPLFSSLAFDLTVTSIFTPLISGGRILVYRTQPGLQATLIVKVVEDGVADIVKLTPAHLAMIKDLNLAATRIRRFVVGGEDFKTALAHDVTQRFGRPVGLYNEYGPTEATVGCMIHCYEQHTDTGASVPIGRPADNACLFILDAALRPVPVGVIGEMYIAGDGLARGYFNRPELTNAAFVSTSDPRDPQARLRLYKTGDLARWSADGRMEFLGRSDHQVKIGGFRIELGEIEARLLTLPGVRECIATVVETQASPNGADTSIAQVAAYYVSDRALPAGTLRAHLAEALPHYMVPAYFEHLDALPVTSNGKIDRSALPVPALPKSECAEAGRPQTDTEKALAGIWAELLQTEGIGPESDFFDMGGHSLLAIKTVSRIREVLNIELKIQAIFEHSTLAALATVLDQVRRVQDVAPRAGVTPIARTARRIARLS